MKFFTKNYQINQNMRNGYILFFLNQKIKTKLNKNDYNIYLHFKELDYIFEEREVTSGF